MCAHHASPRMCTHNKNIIARAFHTVCVNDQLLRHISLSLSYSPRDKDYNPIGFELVTFRTTLGNRLATGTRDGSLKKREEKYFFLADVRTAWHSMSATPSFSAPWLNLVLLFTSNGDYTNLPPPPPLLLLH